MINFPPEITYTWITSTSLRMKSALRPVLAAVDVLAAQIATIRPHIDF